MNKKHGMLTAFGAAVFVSATTLWGFPNQEDKKAQPYTVEAAHTQRNISVEAKIIKEKVTIAAIGDILIHDRVYEDAKTKTGYDFKPMLASVKDKLVEPDLLLANQETVLGGTEIGLSSYPSFNSPIEVGDAIIDAGVDIVSTANNHTLDRGEKAIQSAIGYMTKAGLPYVGSFKNPDDKDRLRILNKNGIDIAYLSYTYGTNGIPVPEGKDYLVNLIDKEAMKEEVHRANKQADVVVMSIHWGNEYQRFPDDIQKELARFLVNEGVDVVFGHHPHVLQPMEWITAGDGRQGLVVYSLGNFLSGQIWDYKDIGGMASVDIIKKVGPAGTTVQLEDPQFYPTYVSSSKQRNYRVVPLEEAGSHGLENAEKKYQEIMSHMTGNLN
ncbi:CapA family protein [Mesobacillus foraminis]|uniref:CapA family protein n=1 Tax=Mesobacillus foraminis TaxID=279826 RepID=UPI001BE7AB36|nr:CapA family protein [Mesobacillus foraminis]MBT2755066.1 CapA family protein [Mesobacillus foraminis]